MVSVLHVASFLGNIGDNANHAGFRPWFERLVGRPVDWIAFEIRDVYRGHKAFDAEFAEAANRADLVVIGGGNYFELWVEKSVTGTSISIPSDVLASIRTPIFFNALGVDEGQGVTETTLGRFRGFLSSLLASDRYLVSVRNDGASDTLRKHVPDLPLDRIIPLPDGGFFARYPALATDRGTNFAINLAGDMLDRRFPGGAHHDYAGFLTEFADMLAALDVQTPELRLVFVPHIFADLRVYADLLSRLPDRIRRERVRVAAYDNGDAAAADAFQEYAAADVAMGMRFHANVVAIAHRVPIVGLFCYDQIWHLYREIDIEEQLVDVRVLGFSEALMARLKRAVSHADEARRRLDQVNQAMIAQRTAAELTILPWLERHGLRG
ncbi:polysaccharide pyruvyl transferase family protein [Bradyrhizobium symbiodeficiens]|uniref:polysaccharide pyruvyl transferase family protein n=1 Tax=Bradyrhizobium symbiodeficiens TaxID=1404367 RepID=UPI001FCE738C|nr:polysaccharide pyruvyl transferase family protein [Bradyrhizobium symbiodeficiens]